MKIAVDTLKASKDSKAKFEKLIKLTTDYEAFIMDINLQGLTNVSAYPFSSQKWVDAYYAFMNAPKSTKKTKKTKIDKTKKYKYNIVLCWTIKADCCICESIINTVQNYMKAIKLNGENIIRTDFIDRTEFCQTFELNCTKEKYELILKSAEYILDISADSIHDKCNIGIFGKEIKNS